TAVKFAFGRYVDWQFGGSIVAANDPVTTMVTNATRTWNDVNGDYIPQESELGPLSNSNFGKTVITTPSAGDVLLGWKTRPYSGQTSVQVQHEIRPGLGVNVGYFRTWFGGFTTTDNLLVAPADYSPFCVVAPADARLPGGGGNQVCGFYDI